MSNERCANVPSSQPAKSAEPKAPQDRARFQWDERREHRRLLRKTLYMIVDGVVVRQR